ncbi:hypothetical protein B0J14DRAFT_571149 [Halenospora varia]|nr:hypothetical protein B0J14DRAFT_571149 [Halenospora varia]
MKAISMVLALAALAPIAIAVPTTIVPQPAEPFITKITERGVTKRDTYWMEMYADANFAGASVTFSGLTTGISCLPPGTIGSALSSILNPILADFGSMSFVALNRKEWY